MSKVVLVVVIHCGLLLQGVVAGIGGGRGYVDVSTVDAATSKRIADAITYADCHLVARVTTHHSFLVLANTVVQNTVTT